MSQKIVVFATSFLDSPTVEIEETGTAVQLLQQFTEENKDIVIEWRCTRDPREPLTPDDLQDVVAVIADLEAYDRPLLQAVSPEHGGSLRLIARYGVGVNSIDLEAAAEYGIRVANTPQAPSEPTAEWTVALMLGVAGRIVEQHDLAIEGNPKSGRSRLDLGGRVLGVIGTGRIGRRVVELLSGFKMTVLANDIYPNTDWAEEHGVSYVDRSELLERADFVTIHTGGGETVVGHEELSLMKPTAVLVNCARDVLVDRHAVVDRLRAGRLYGYGVDESWSGPELSAEDNLNIVSTPHIGSDTDRGKVSMQIETARTVINYLEGKPLENTVV